MYGMEAVNCTSQDLRRLFRIATSWGDAWITAVDDDVIAFTPPLPNSHKVASCGIEDCSEMLQRFSEVNATARALIQYFNGDPVELATQQQVEKWLTVAGIKGFQKRVLVTLVSVPRGVTISYGELAELAGSPGAARAAGSACAKNPLPIIIPCHRVLHSGARGGDVGRYGAATGAGYKRLLLELEDAPFVRDTWP